MLTASHGYQLLTLWPPGGVDGSFPAGGKQRMAAAVRARASGHRPRHIHVRSQGESAPLVTFMSAAK
eukprot:1180275-Prorocentrum_minimum.AAC.1